MKRRDIKRRWFFYEVMEKDALIRMLEAEEARGWRLTDLSHCLVFHRAQPRRVRYAAVLVASAGAYDHQPTREVQEYMDYCAAAGWEYVCGSGKWRIFRTEDPSAPPVESEPKVELAVVRKAYRRSFWACLAVVGLMLFLLALLGWAWSDWLWESFFSQYGSWTLPITLLCGLGFCVCFAARYLLWSREQGRRAARGEPVAYLTHNRLSWGCLLLFGLLPLAAMVVTMALDLGRGNRGGVETALALLSVLPLGLAGWGAALLLARKKADPETNRRLGPFLAVLLAVLLFARSQIVQSDAVENRLFHTARTVTVEDWWEYTIYQDEVPLTLADLGVEYDPKWEDRKQLNCGRAMISRLQYWDREANPWEEGYHPSLWCAVYSSAYPVLFEKCLEKYRTFLTQQAEPVEAPGLSAGAVYYCEDNGDRTWLAVYEDCLIEVRANFHLTDDMLALAEEKLLAWVEAD